MKLVTRDAKRGGIWAGVTALGMATFLSLGGAWREPGTLLLGVAFFAVIAFLIGSKPRERGVVRRGTEVARTVVPSFTVSRYLMGMQVQSGILLDERNKTLLLFDGGGKRCLVVPESALISSELIEDGTTVSTSSTNRTSQLAGAAVGGLVFGGVGAVVGALTGKKNSRTRNEISEVALRLTLNDRTHPSFRVQLFKAKEPVLRDSAQGRRILQKAEEADALMSVIIRQAAA